MKVASQVLAYLEQRGIKSPEHQMRFLFPRLSDHYDPLLLKGMKDALELLKPAVKEKKRVLIWGDADLDGISSTVLVKSALLDLGLERVEVRIPTRDSPGFGLIPEEIKTFKESGGDLIVTVDVGITNLEEAKLAKELGLELIITDHHELLEPAPDAICINPKQTDCSYPFRELAGTGVALKLVSALYRELVGLSTEELAKLRPHYWMFAALGTVSDRCPLIDENRLIVHEGLSRYREGKWPSLDSWLEAMGLEASNLTVFDLYSRGISPFYSTDPEEVVELLLSRNKEWMRNRYSELKILASSWQRGKQYMIAEAEKTAKQVGGIVVSLTGNIDPAYLGTAAHSLREHHTRNAIVLTPKGNAWRAECRGLEEGDLLRHLARFEEMFKTFGGHRKACGFTLKAGKLDDFLEALENEPIPCPEHQDKDAERPVLNFPLNGNIEDWSLLAPFGEGNPPPRLRAKKVKITESTSGYKVDGIPIYLPIFLRHLPSTNGRFDMEYTVKADGTIRVLRLIPVA
ncbi:hypothetical protein GF359_01990 [candidate division WOR-3 bacterium]|uniref:Single-stranded-DNA-specific exonuclease RecJ n=1 Tax=candidate division WOR-3 bacterium TaxID=2052148 RepID=A0A9D5K890_UNCW3|nr:hypothetical protein [candidate division WOR-3 bacterium]MBD3363965.1 hypothetical protein [candidate division WOR-3 bacterium]